MKINYFDYAREHKKKIQEQIQELKDNGDDALFKVLFVNLLGVHIEYLDRYILDENGKIN